VLCSIICQNSGIDRGLSIEGTFCIKVKKHEFRGWRSSGVQRIDLMTWRKSRYICTWTTSGNVATEASFRNRVGNHGSLQIGRGDMPKHKLVHSLSDSSHYPSFTIDRRNALRTKALGSDSSLSERFFDSVSPCDALFSVGGLSDTSDMP